MNNNSLDIEILENGELLPIYSEEEIENIINNIDNPQISNKSKIHIILDNGHGTPPLTGGKQSPDGSIKEGEYTREIVKRIKNRLDKLNVKSTILVPEIKDIKLQDRVKRINDICSIDGTSNCLLISIHLNAHGMGEDWMPGRGWECYVHNISSQKSKDFAKMCCESAKEILGDIELDYPEKNKKIPLRHNNQPQTANFYILTCKCPAVLTENLFMTNQTECEWLKTEEGKENIIKLHIKAINNYIKKYE